ncbi:MAG TPA: flagellar biosynthesis anti-sigma factor FlgM [Terriglobales bacterium]|nr:flagellar biosynthesis anti-sigma factor FlgM [Terriglobales bacterium]
MRINPQTPPSNEISAERMSSGQTAANSARSPQVDKFGGDTVSLSSLAAQTLQMPPVRQDKVDALRQRVESGDYDVDPRGTAEAMLNG